MNRLEKFVIYESKSKSKQILIIIENYQLYKKLLYHWKAHKYVKSI